MAGRRAWWKRLEAEIESNGRVCQVSKVIEVERIESEIRNFVDKPTILRAHAEVPNDVDIGAATVDEGATRLTVGSGHDELFSRIEDQSAAPAKDVRTHRSHVHGNVSD